MLVEKVSLWLPYVKFKPSIHKEFETLVLKEHPLYLMWQQPRVVV